MATKLECFLPFLATCHDFFSPGPWFNIMVTSYQYRNSHCGDKMIFWPSYLHNRISHTGKITSLYWNGFLTMSFKMADEISTSLVAVWVLYLYVLNLSEGADILTFYVIPPHWYDTGNWNPSPSKIRTYLFYIVSIMADLALIAQKVRAFGMNPKVGGSSPPRVGTIFCLKNFDTFTRTSVRVSKMNAVACVQLTLQMSTLLQKYST